MEPERESDSIQFLIDIFMQKKGRESIFQKYGDEGFDTFTGYLDWDFLDLKMIVEKELKFLEKAELILSDESSEELLKSYGLEQEQDYYEKIEKLLKNLKMKIESRNLIQKYPELEILFSIVSIIYLRNFDVERKEFKDKKFEILVKEVLRTLIQFYSAHKHRNNIIDDENLLGRKIVILISMLDGLTFCYNLDGVPDEGMYQECELVINMRILRAAMMDEIYRKKSFNSDTMKLRNVCREVVADLRRAIYLQWVLNYEELVPILYTLTNKITIFAREGIDLPYEKIIRETKELFPPIYLRNEEKEAEKRRELLEIIKEAEKILERNY